MPHFMVMGPKNHKVTAIWDPTCKYTPDHIFNVILVWKSQGISYCLESGNPDIKRKEMLLKNDLGIGISMCKR